DLTKLLGVTGEPLLTSTWSGHRCMARYAVGHLDRVDEIERRAAAIPGLALAGNAYRGVGIPDCIHSGEQAAEMLVRTPRSSSSPLASIWSRGTPAEICSSHRPIRFLKVALNPVSPPMMLFRITVSSSPRRG